MAQTKIATCCYCGTKAALVLKGDTQHELSCASCGAALHNIKHLPKGGWGDQKSKPVKPKRVPPNDRSMRKKKKKKSLGQRILGEVFDVVEDAFDDLF